MSTKLMIRKLRNERGLTQEQLAEALDVSIMTVRRWEWGQTTPNAKLLKKLSDVLETTPEMLMDDTKKDDIEVIGTISTKHTKTDGMANFSLGNGFNFSAPATPEGYAFLKDALAIAMKQQAVPAVG